MTAPTDEIRIPRDVALLLFELLASAGPTGAIRPVDSADQNALWVLEGELERLLPEPFLPNYRDIVEPARSRLRNVEPEHLRCLATLPLLMSTTHSFAPSDRRGFQFRP